MADITSVSGFKVYCAGVLSQSYFFATLHNTSGNLLTAATSGYASGLAGELLSGFGYIQGGYSIGQGIQVNNAVDTSNVVWTASGGSIGPASYAALWVNGSNAVDGSKLVCVKDSAASPQTATDGNTMTVTISSPISF